MSTEGCRYFCVLHDYIKLKSPIIIVRHHEGDLDDIASVHLANSGFTVEHCYPFKESEPQFGLPDVSRTRVERKSAIKVADRTANHTENNTENNTPANTAGIVTDAVTEKKIAGAVVMGGAQNVTELNELPYLQREVEWIRDCIAADVPVIGICLGAQLVAHALGGTVEVHAEGLCEFGYVPVYPVPGNDWIDEPLHMVQAHFQGFTVPPDCTELATGTRFPHQAFHYREKAFAFQFHPEVTEEMFVEWQNAEWANEFYSSRGAQPKSEACQYNALYNGAQEKWFCNVLDRVFS